MYLGRSRNCISRSKGRAESPHPPQRTRTKYPKKHMSPMMQYGIPSSNSMVKDYDDWVTLTAADESTNCETLTTLIGNCTILKKTQDTKVRIQTAATVMNISQMVIPTRFHSGLSKSLSYRKMAKGKINPRFTNMERQNICQRRAMLNPPPDPLELLASTVRRSSCPWHWMRVKTTTILQKMAIPDPWSSTLEQQATRQILTSRSNPMMTRHRIRRNTSMDAIDIIIGFKLTVSHKYFKDHSTALFLNYARICQNSLSRMNLSYYSLEGKDSRNLCLASPISFLCSPKCSWMCPPLNFSCSCFARAASWIRLYFFCSYYSSLPNFLSRFWNISSPISLDFPLRASLFSMQYYLKAIYNLFTSLGLVSITLSKLKYLEELKNPISQFLLLNPALQSSQLTPQTSQIFSTLFVSKYSSFTFPTTSRWNTYSPYSENLTLCLQVKYPRIYPSPLQALQNLVISNSSSSPTLLKST